MHPYQMQRLIRQRHNDEFLDLKRGSLYHAIQRLAKAGFIEEDSTSREGRRPERTVYRITDAGLTHLGDWLRHLLSRPARESSSFVAALSFLPYLTPDEVRDQLELRIAELECGIIAVEAVLKQLVPQIGRVCMIEAEYSLAMRRAELHWVRQTIQELRDGTFTWNREQLLEMARAHEHGSPVTLDVESRPPGNAN
jgi:DNA-binding PadR family transcriptional regulator